MGSRDRRTRRRLKRGVRRHVWYEIEHAVRHVLCQLHDLELALVEYALHVVRRARQADELAFRQAHRGVVLDVPHRLGCGTRYAARRARAGGTAPAMVNIVLSPCLPRNMSCCSTSTLNVVLVTLQNVALSPLTNLLARFFFTPRYLQRKRFSSGAATRHAAAQRSVHCDCGGRDAKESGEE